jgi:hypothetical protein
MMGCNQLRDLEAREKFHGMTQMKPFIPWSVDAITHTAVLESLESWAQASTAMTFPKDKAKPRPGWIGLATWELNERRGEYLKVVRIMAKKIARRPRNEQATAWNATNRIYAAMAMTLHAEIRKAAKDERKSFLEDLSEQLAAACNTKVVMRACSVLKYFRAGGRKPKVSYAKHPRMVLLEDGTPAETPTAAAMRWRRHFSAMEAGQNITLQQIADEAAGRQMITHEETLELEAKHLPTLQTVEGLFAAVKVVNAMSDYCIPGELFPQLLARKHMPVMFEAAY